MKYAITVGIWLSLVAAAIGVWGWWMFDATHPTYDVVILRENGVDSYAIRDCRGIDGCRLYGYRYKMSELAEAKACRDWFRNYKKPYIVEVVK